MKDCVIIGKGPAGLSAALYVRRAGYTPLVIGRDSGALGQSHRIENYFGLAEPVSGDELFRRGLVQVERLGIEVISDEVVSIRESNGFIVNTSSGSSYTARTVLLATGKQRISSNLDADHLIGYGVSHCAQCDGFLMRGRSLAVVGSGDHAVAELNHLRPLTEHLRLFTNGATITTHNIPSDIPIVTEPITELRTDDFGMLSGIQTEKQLYPTEGLFLAQGIASAADFAVAWASSWTTATSRSTAAIRPMYRVCSQPVTVSAVSCKLPRLWQTAPSPDSTSVSFCETHRKRKILRHNNQSGQRMMHPLPLFLSNIKAPIPSAADSIGASFFFG